MRPLRFLIDHRFTSRRLSPYLDGELGAADRRRVDQHIAACPDCESKARSLRNVLEGLEQLRSRAPSALTAKVLQALRQPSGDRMSR